MKQTAQKGLNIDINSINREMIVKIEIIIKLKNFLKCYKIENNII